jgi:ssDNA-binding replication factor A large subunit
VATSRRLTLIDIQSGSGLIKRCPHEDCTRVLQNARRSEPSEVDGEFDLRTKDILNNGTEVHEMTFNQEMTEELTGVTLAEAHSLAETGESVESPERVGNDESTNTEEGASDDLSGSEESSEDIDTELGEYE